MADSAFREAQWRRRYDAHIASINALVDSLRETGLGWLPYVAPMYGGIRARLLSVLRDPGPKTRSDRGSGFLSMENDDATAEAINGHFADAGISAVEVVPWNVYPWYINRAPTSAELRAGIGPLHDLLHLLPNLRVVMLHGGCAQRGWRLFEREYPGLANARRLHVIKTFTRVGKRFGIETLTYGQRGANTSVTHSPKPLAY